MSHFREEFKEMYNYFKLSLASHRTTFRCFCLMNCLKLDQARQSVSCYFFFYPLLCRIYTLNRTITSFNSQTFPSVLLHFRTQHFLPPCAKLYQWSAFPLEMPFCVHKYTKTGYTRATGNWQKYMVPTELYLSVFQIHNSKRTGTNYHSAICLTGL